MSIIQWALLLYCLACVLWALVEWAASRDLSDVAPGYGIPGRGPASNRKKRKVKT